jgi:hypothetical protein
LEPAGTVRGVDESEIPRGGALRGVLGFIVFVPVFFGLVYLVEVVEDFRAGPLPKDTPAATAPMAPPPADGGSYSDPEAILAAFAPSQVPCYVQTKPWPSTPRGARVAWCTTGTNDPCCTETVVADVYGSPDALREALTNLQPLPPGQSDATVLAGRNWTLRAPSWFLRRVWPWLGGTLLRSV